MIIPINNINNKYTNTKIKNNNQCADEKSCTKSCSKNSNELDIMAQINRMHVNFTGIKKIEPNYP